MISADQIGCFGRGGNVPNPADGPVNHITFFSRPATVDFLVASLQGKPLPIAHSRSGDSLAVPASPWRGWRQPPEAAGQRRRANYGEAYPLRHRLFRRWHQACPHNRNSPGPVATMCSTSRCWARDAEYQANHRGNPTRDFSERARYGTNANPPWRRRSNGLRTSLRCRGACTTSLMGSPVRRNCPMMKVLLSSESICSKLYCPARFGVSMTRRAPRSPTAACI